MKKKGIIFSTIGMIVVFAGIAAGALLVKRNQDIREKAAPATILRLTGTSTTVSPGDTFNADVLMDTGQNSVTGLDVIVTFDPAAFQVTSVEKGTGITALSNEIRNTYDNSAGTVTYSVYTLDTAQAVNGSGISVLRIAFRVTDTANSGNYTFDFGGATAVAATTEGQNVLIDSVPLSVTVEGGQTAGTPTATPTPTQSAQDNSTPTSTPTATATQSAQNTSTPTATATATSTSGVGGGSNATATATPFPVPETGVGSTFIIGAGLGAAALVFATLLLAF